MKINNEKALATLEGLDSSVHPQPSIGGMTVGYNPYLKQQTSPPC